MVSTWHLEGGLMTNDDAKELEEFSK